MANIHKILSKGGVVIDPNEIVYTQWTPEFDINELKLLHREWFPIDYDVTFFDKIVDGTQDCFLATYPYKTKKKRNNYCIIGAILFNIQEIDYSKIQFTFDSFWEDFFTIYILTIGVVNEARRLGIATKFL